MNRYILFMALTAGVLSAMCQKATLGDVSANEQNSDVSMTITKFHVDEQSLELGFKIINDTDHDVWILKSIDFLGSGFEAYVTEDNKALLIRRRLDVPTIAIWMGAPYGWYSRLRPGEQWIETLKLDLPIIPSWLFPVPMSTAEYAQRIVLEVGYHKKDLPRMVTRSEELYPDPEMIDLVGVWYPDPANDDEHILQITVEGVSIPYEDEPPLSETEPAGVTIALTGLDVNDTTLELCYKIKNNSDHDVWVCNGFNRGESIYYFERYIDKDHKTLVLRRRYNLSSEGIMVQRYPSPFRYIRLRPGQEKVESHSFTLPVTPITLFHAPGEGRLNVESAQRLAIEIGFYDEDLRALILGVVEIAERLGCDDSAIRNVESSDASAMRLYYRFFGGFKIARLFTTENITYFRDSVTSDGDEILMPPMHQALNGEQVLRIEVDNLPIPFSIH